MNIRASLPESTTSEAAHPPVVESRSSLLWKALERAYVSEARRRAVAEEPTSSPTACRAVQLVSDALARGGTLYQLMQEARVRASQTELRGQELATRLLLEFSTEPGGLGDCLRRASRPGGFDWLRDRLEDGRFGRTSSWRLCLALRESGLLRSEPDRPYLDGHGIALTKELWSKSGPRVRTMRDREAAIMILAEYRLHVAAELQPIDPEILSAACAGVVLNGPNNGR